MEGSDGDKRTQAEPGEKYPNIKRLIIKLTSFLSLPTEMKVIWKGETNVVMLSSLCHNVYIQRIDLSVHVVPKSFQ